VKGEIIPFKVDRGLNLREGGVYGFAQVDINTKGLNMTQKKQEVEG
jgi:hypothetical protein